MYNERLRPQFHFSAREGWINDPNGLVYFDGLYHLFFQHNPSGIEWGNMTWGHATSPDLLHWTQHEHAIYPDDEGTIFSGSAVVDWNNTAGFQVGATPALVAIYTCAGDTSPASVGKPFTQCLAVSTDGGLTWEKFSGNPILEQVSPGNRDPKVIWYEPTGKWVMALYFEGNDFGLFTSPDLKVWTLTQRFVFPGADECPDFFELAVEETGERMWVYTAANGRYLVGSFDGERFVPVQEGAPMDLGPNYYAVQTYSDIPTSDGRRIQVAWMRGDRYLDMPFNQQMSIPCVLTLHREDSAYRIHRNPVQEVARLRQRSVSTESRLLEPDTSILISNDEFGCWDVALAINPNQATELVLAFRGIELSYSVTDQLLSLQGRSTPFPLRNGVFVLRCFIDKTSIELFDHDGGFSYTSCYLPGLDDSSLQLKCLGGTAEILSIDCHDLRSIWNVSK